MIKRSAFIFFCLMLIGSVATSRGDSTPSGQTYGEEGQTLSFKALVSDAHAGNHAAQAVYCKILALGDQEFAKNLEEATRWCKKSAEGGNARGQLLYAILLRTGNGVKKDAAAAYYWATKSYKQGDPEAHSYLRFIEEEMTSEERERAEVLLRD